MRWWPFSRPTETRASNNYTTQAQAAALAAATGGVTADAAATAAAEACAGLYSRALSLATVTPSNAITRALSPMILSYLGRELIVRGEGVLLVDVQPGVVTLVPACSWDIAGSWARASWSYSLEVAGPSTTVRRRATADGVLHVMYSTRPADPSKGRGPLQNAGLTANVLAKLERSLGYEAGKSTGTVIPVPPPVAPVGDDEDLEDDAQAQFRRDVGDLKGSTVLAETFMGGAGSGQGVAPQADWAGRLFGPAPKDTAVALRTDVAEAVRSACGVPISLDSRSDGTAQRESFRRWHHSSLLPVAEIIREAAAVALQQPDLRIEFPRLSAADLTGKARATGQLVTAGVELERAIQIVGL